MRKPIFGFAVIAGITVMTTFFLISQEIDVQSARYLPRVEDASPYYSYKLQYSHNGKIWHDLIIIENGELSKNIEYLRRGNKFPLLRYWYTYTDTDGELRAVSIPLTVESPPEQKSRRG